MKSRRDLILDDSGLPFGAIGASLKAILLVSLVIGMAGLLPQTNLTLNLKMLVLFYLGILSVPIIRSPWSSRGCLADIWIGATVLVEVAAIIATRFLICRIAALMLAHGWIVSPLDACIPRYQEAEAYFALFFLSLGALIAWLVIRFRL